MALNNTHFDQRPTVTMPRSTFNTPKNIRTTFNSGLLIPFYVQQDIYPGDTFKLKNLSAVVRTSTPIHPTMDNAYVDFFFFSIPKRICWEHFRDMMGENRLGAWNNNAVEYTEPQLKFVKTSSTSTSNTIKVGDIAHYMGLPLFDPTLNAGESSRTISVSRLPFTAYIKTWNEYFRCQSVESPAYEPYNDNDHYTITDDKRGNNTYNTWHTLNILTDTAIQPTPAPVNRFASWYSTATPQPQFGSSIKTPLGTTAPIISNGFGIKLTDGSQKNIYLNSQNLTAGNGIGQLAPQSSEKNIGDTITAGYPVLTNKVLGLSDENNGLYADLTNATAATINALRLSFATQRILERDVFGNRFREIIKNHFHTSNADARMQIPEFLFSFRQPLNMTEVPQTSSTDATTPQGNLAAYSHTVAINNGFVKSFTEWSIILGVMCVRADSSFSQGIEPQWTRKRRLDYYWPELSHIGEQPILTKTLFADGTSNDDTVFGYQEAWSEMKYERNLNTGYMDPKAPTTLASWNYADEYSNAPVLSPEWMNYNKAYIDRTLAVNSSVTHQLIADIHLDITQTKAMPIYNLPGYADHY